MHHFGVKKFRCECERVIFLLCTHSVFHLVHVIVVKGVGVSESGYVKKFI